jgi:transposase
MAYRHGDREQTQLLPQCIEDYVTPDAPVRVFDAFVEALSLKDLGIDYNPHKTGNPEYDPKAMLKLLVYGYAYGVRSSRRLEREACYNLSFIWLTGNLRPDHKTIAEFRRQNKKALQQVLKQCARMCLRLNLIAGNSLFVDGSKIRANAGWKQQWTKARAKKALANIDEHIRVLLTECERIDTAESGSESFVKISEELKDQTTLRAKVKQILAQLKTDDDSLNSTDPESNPMHSTKGTFPSYNVQQVVDGKHGLIVSADAVSDPTDVYQFANQIELANQTLEKSCTTACADAGYANTDETTKIDAQHIQVIVPTNIQARDQAAGPFAKSKFTYDADRNEYRCPEGHPLTYIGYDSTSRKHEYRIHAKETCLTCPHFGICTKSRRGRRIKRLALEEIKNKLETQYSSPLGQAIYKLRKQNAEHPFGHLRRNLGVQYFLMRGLDGVKAEMSLLATCFNLVRMITLIGVPGLLNHLALTSTAGT